MKRLQNIIQTTNFASLRQKKPGSCPSAHDGQDIIYTFYTAKGAEEINTCEYAVDLKGEPFKTLLEIREKKQ